MKKLMFATIAIFTLVMFSCNGGGKTEKGASENEEETKKSESSENVKAEKIKDCDDFIKAYEKLVDEYIKFLRKHKDNPMEAMTDPKYMEYAQEVVDYSSKWTNLAKCATSEYYMKEFEKIVKKHEKVFEEMGME